MRRSTRIVLRTVVAASAVTAFALTATACEDTSTKPPADNTVATMEVDKIYYADFWKGDGHDTTDEEQSELEQKPNGTWVVNTESEVSKTASNKFVVKIQLTKDGLNILDTRGALAGKDHDFCLIPADDEVWVKVSKSVKFEREPSKPNKSDEC